jgi:hypothetical protein
MRKIRDVLRLSAAGLSKRQIAASLGIGPTAAGACLRRAREAGISWPLPDDLGDAALECRLYPAPAAAAKDWRSRPDWPAVHRELRRKGVTLQLVWEEYRATHPDGYSRSRFCELYRAWEGRLSPTMRQASRFEHDSHADRNRTAFNSSTDARAWEDSPRRYSQRYSRDFRSHGGRGSIPKACTRQSVFEHIP